MGSRACWLAGDVVDVSGESGQEQKTKKKRVRFDNLMENVFGTCDPRFDQAEKAFLKNFDGGWEREGASFAVYYRGELVVDLQGGYKDASSLTKWTDSTRLVIFSVTKAVASLVVAMLVDRRRLRYEQKVAEFWAGFAKNNKQNITVQMIMCHQAGLVVFDEKIGLDKAADHRIMGRLIENMAPVWEPGTKSGYHAITFGWLVDQIVRRVDEKGRGVGQFIREEISEPYGRRVGDEHVVVGIDFFLGLPSHEQHTVARLSSPSYSMVIREVAYDPRIVLASILLRLGGDASLRRQAKNISFVQTQRGRNTFNSPDLHRLEQPAALGITKAKDLAKMFSLMLSGNLVSADVVRRFDEPQVMCTDCALNVPSVKGHGFMYERHPVKQGKYLYGHPGYGGSNLMIDSEDQLVIVYLCNGMKAGGGELNLPYRRLRNAVLKSVQRIQKNV